MVTRKQVKAIKAKERFLTASKVMRMSDLDDLTNVHDQIMPVHHVKEKLKRFRSKKSKNEYLKKEFGNVGSF